MTEENNEPYSIIIKFLHAALAIFILLQLFIGEFMSVPEVENAGEPPAIETIGFSFHEFFGLIIAGIIFLRIGIAFTSIPCSTFGSLFPWLSKKGKDDLLSEIKEHITIMKKGDVMRPEQGNLLAKSVHGLMIASTALMALSGFFLYLNWSIVAPQTELVEFVAHSHENIVVFLKALILFHVFASVMHHVRGHKIFDRISPLEK